MLVALKDTVGDLFVVNTKSICDFCPWTDNEGTPCVKLSDKAGFWLIPGSVEDLIVRLNGADAYNITFI